MTAPDIPQRVARGVALLDEKRPGWDQKVNVEALDLGDCWSCVIGQLYRPERRSMWANPFDVGALDLFGADAYGFDKNAPVLIEHGFSDTDERSEFEALTVEWTRVISDRRAAPSSAALPLGEEK